MTSEYRSILIHLKILPWPSRSALRPGGSSYRAVEDGCSSFSSRPGDPVQAGSPGTSPGVAIDPPPAAFVPPLPEGLLFIVGPDALPKAQRNG